MEIVSTVARIKSIQFVFFSPEIGNKIKILFFKRKTEFKFFFNSFSNLFRLSGERDIPTRKPHSVNLYYGAPNYHVMTLAPVRENDDKRRVDYVDGGNL